MIDVAYMLEPGSFDGVVIILDKTLNILKTNQEFLKLQGYKNTDLHMKPFIDIIVPEDKSLFFDASYTTDNSKEFTIQCYHKQGAFRYYTFNMIKFNEYKILFGKAIKKEFDSFQYVEDSSNYLEKAFSKLDVDDISELLVKEDKNLSMFLSFFPMDIWIKDRYNRYVFVNETHTVHTGHTLDDVYLRDDYQLFPKEIAKGFISSDQEAITTGKKVTFSFYSSLDNLLTWSNVIKIPLYNTNQKYIGLLGFAIDVSELKLVEDRLNNILEKYEYSMKELDVFIAEIETDETITFAGGGLIQELEFNKSLILTKNIEVLNISDETLKQKLSLCFKGEKQILNTTMNNQKMTIVLHPYITNEVVSSVIMIATRSEEG